jgi:uncharacterized protein YlbG (UPF0298 family)
MLETRYVSNHEREEKMLRIYGNLWYSSDDIAVFNMAMKS